MKGKFTTLCFIFLSLVFLQCTTMRMIVKGRPGIYDYKKYPYRLVAKKGSVVFNFPLSERYPGLDTIIVNSTEPLLMGSQMTLKNYLLLSGTLEFLVIKDDSLVYHFQSPEYRQTWVNTFSISKSIISLLLGIAIKEGKIKDINDNVTVYLPELLKNRAFEGVTLKHLMMMTSGLRFSKISKNLLKTLASDEAKDYFIKNLRKYIAASERECEPGKYWQYKNTDVEIASWVLEVATGKKVSDYLSEKIWAKIGASSDAAWTVDGENNERTHCCFYTKADGLAKLGKLLLQNGEWNGEQIIPESWIEKLKKFDSTQVGPSPQNKDIRIMQHQYLWWKPVYPAGEDFQANGVSGQCLYIDPVSKIIIVKLANKNMSGNPYRKIASYLTNKPYKVVVPRHKLY